MEVHVVPGGNGCPVQRSRLVVPAAKGGLDLLVDAVADGLHDPGFGTQATYEPACFSAISPITGSLNICP